MPAIDFMAEARSVEDELRETRRDFHRHPELGFEEVRTSGIVANRLNALGLEVQTGVARTGVVGLLEGARPGPVVMLRFDMDALPIEEANTTSYVSQTPGVMHACGHDGHTAIGLSLARLLVKHRARLAGTVKFVFQPAEEGRGGATTMIRDGVLDGPRPAVALGLHLWNEMPFGQVGVSAGPSMASGDILHITITGRGGHGAVPHETADPIVAAAHIITALQTVVSRNLPANETAVVSVTTIHAGSAFNVIPSEVELGGTIRTFSVPARDRVLERLNAVVEGVAEGMGVDAHVHIDPLAPAVVNDAEVAGVVRSAAVELVGEHALRPAFTMGSEDMACFLREVPGCFFFVGSANEEKGLHYPHHNARFDFDERAMGLGVAVLFNAVTKYLVKE